MASANTIHFSSIPNLLTVRPPPAHRQPRRRPTKKTFRTKPRRCASRKKSYHPPACATRLQEQTFVRYVAPCTQPTRHRAQPPITSTFANYRTFCTRFDAPCQARHECAGVANPLLPKRGFSPLQTSSLFPARLRAAALRTCCFECLNHRTGGLSTIRMVRCPPR